MAKRLLGKEVTAALNERIKADVAALEEKGVKPTLGIIRVGENESDISYERGATKRCETLGVACEKVLLPADVSQENLLAEIEKMNKNDNIHGVLLFRPLPKHLDQAVIENALDPAKDVDCMTDGSMTGVFTGKEVGFPPYRQKSGCHRQKPGSRKTCSYDADQKECHSYRMPYKNGRYAFCCKRSRYRYRGSRPGRRGRRYILKIRPDCH